MEFNLSSHKIKISESLNAIHFYIYEKDGSLLHNYSVDKKDLDKSTIKNIDIKDFPTLKTINIKKV
jgi:hypothetical protein